MEIKAVRTDRYEMEYCSFGSGKRAFVIIPGVSMKPVMASAATIKPAFEAFTERYTVYVFDRKKNIRPGYSVMQMAEDTADAMQRLGIGNADIFGASQGGMIAQCIAICHPELVHALYLASTLARQNAVSMENLDRWIELGDRGDWQALNHAIHTTVYSDAFYARYAKAFAYLEKQGNRDETARFAVLARACREFDIYDRLGEIRCPVFVTGAGEDRVLGCDGAREIAERLNCPIYVYETGSHAVYDEDESYRLRMLEALSGLD